jgi:hypothetical protein
MDADQKAKREKIIEEYQRDVRSPSWLYDQAFIAAEQQAAQPAPLQPKCKREDCNLPAGHEGLHSCAGQQAVPQVHATELHRDLEELAHSWEVSLDMGCAKELRALVEKHFHATTPPPAPEELEAQLVRLLAIWTDDYSRTLAQHFCAFIRQREAAKEQELIEVTMRYQEMHRRFTALAGERTPLRLLKASQAVMELLESGALVRDTRGDHDRDWAIKQIPLVRCLAEFDEAIKECAALAPPAQGHKFDGGENWQICSCGERWNPKGDPPREQWKAHVAAQSQEEKK